MITNYDTVHADLDLIGAWSPDLVILDEAQRIKNWNTRTARSVKRIASPYAIVLTGTPLENRLEELVSIVEFVDRHRLGPTFRFLADHQVHDEHGKVVGYRDLDRIGQTLAPILIRRTKTQVLSELPERLDKNFFVPMTPQQRRAPRGEPRDRSRKIVAKWRRYKFLSEADQRRLMIALQNMRMSCDSTYLLDHETDFGVKADELATLLDEVLEQPGCEGRGLQPVGADARAAGQAAGEEAVRSRAVPRRRGGAQRKALVDRFREDDRCRAFLSTDAGGVGLEPAARLGRRQHGPALESGRPGAAHRPRPSPGPAPARARRQLHRRGHDRRRHAVGAEVQEVALRRRARRRRAGGVPRRQPTDPVHGDRRADDRGDHRRQRLFIERKGRPPTQRSRDQWDHESQPPGLASRRR